MGTIRRIYAELETDVDLALRSAYRDQRQIEIDGLRATIVAHRTACVALEHESERKQREAFDIEIHE